jgi:sulfide:quinone oxidoreductase
MSAKTTVVLGGGVGGLVAANALRRLLPAHHRVMLIERDQYHSFAPSFLWVMTGARNPEQIQRPVASLVASGVEIKHATVVGIDVKCATVETDRGSVAYDYLITALGAELAFDAVPGLRDAGHSFYTVTGASKLHEALRVFKKGRIVVVIASLPYKCPGAPLEGAMLIADFMRKTRRQNGVEVALYTPEPQPMPVAGPILAEAALQMLQARHISYQPLHRLLSVDSEAKQLTFDGPSQVPYDLLVTIPPHRSPEVVRQSGLAAPSGWIPVDRATMRVQAENVFAIGDVASIALPGRWKPDVPLLLPKAGVFAHAQALVAAEQIAANVVGRDSAATFCGDGYCMLEAGEDLAGFAYGNFLAEPSPDVRLKRIGKAWHIGKVLFEKWWLTPPGRRRRGLEGLLNFGARLYGIPGVSR